MKRETELEARVRNGKAAMALVIPTRGTEPSSGGPDSAPGSDARSVATAYGAGAYGAHVAGDGDADDRRVAGAAVPAFLGDLGFHRLGSSAQEAIFESTFDRMDALSEDTCGPRGSRPPEKARNPILEAGSIS
ncbi:MAG: hypothetical protein R3E96_09630 [Planctomycetota bacterium]